MSSLSFLSVYLSGALMILLLTAVSQAQDYDFTPAPDYDSDYNATFEYSFYSSSGVSLDVFSGNGSSEDLEKFSEPFIDLEEETVTTTTTTGSTESVDVRNSTSLPVSLAIRTLVWTLMIMISVNLQQLQHTL
ncbi:uncharacterized protein si:ch211-191i18.2 isoform X3 [Hippoglossus stenolepis]|uniref:uncharacterized protein si:ch211-191i18.2 isoform X3 n=1 Tax=Hippoglossus stenolepis TaxID=195615 RepID=UPI001FAE950C|nr:uncharacterized protein si:ch211-191i18.2 isoform X3 [Hippoglossus stenolepis]